MKTAFHIIMGSLAIIALSGMVFAGVNLYSLTKKDSGDVVRYSPVPKDDRIFVYRENGEVLYAYEYDYDHDGTRLGMTVFNYDGTLSFWPLFDFLQLPPDVEIVQEFEPEWAGDKC